MIIEGKKIYFVIEHEFDGFVSKLASSLELIPETDDSMYYHGRYGYWNWNHIFGKNSKEMWDSLEKKLNMTYVRAVGPTGCHVFDFNSEADRLKFQLKYGDVMNGN